MRFGKVESRMWNGMDCTGAELEATALESPAETTHKQESCSFRERSQTAMLNRAPGRTASHVQFIAPELRFRWRRANASVGKWRLFEKGAEDTRATAR